MRDFFVRFLKNNDAVLFFYNMFFRLKNRARFVKENETRARLPIFNYRELAKPIPYYPEEAVRDSNYYGYARAIREYAGVKELKVAIEHGLYLGDRVSTAEGYRTTRSVIAMSQNRVDSFKLHGLKKPIIAIGPYIHYAEPLLNEDEFNALKKELGRVLLVMPVHAARRATVDYNITLLVECIESIRNEYDTVMVCLHFRDVLNNPECVSDYENKGYRIVCAGNAFDTFFVRRLKSIIMLSDYVISNSHGTNTGFCTYLGKPQTIIHDPDLVKHHTSYTDEVQKIRDEQVLEIESAFYDYSNTITEDQYRIVDKYWGLSCIKSKEELKRAIIEINSLK